MLQVGLTGGIGSGKSIIAYLFSLLDIPVYNADRRAKELMQGDEDLREQIIDIFGEEAYSDEGTVNRKWLANKVFSDGALLKELNALVHPRVRKDAADWFAKQNEAPYAVEEAALLVETESYRQLDRLIVVTAPRDIRIERVCQRDGVKTDQVEARMEHQAPQEALTERADFIINNDGKHLLIPQVKTIDSALRTANTLPIL